MRAGDYAIVPKQRFYVQMILPALRGKADTLDMIRAFGHKTGDAIIDGHAFSRDGQHVCQTAPEKSRVGQRRQGKRLPPGRGLPPAWCQGWRQGAPPVPDSVRPPWAAAAAAGQNNGPAGVIPDIFCRICAAPTPMTPGSVQPLKGTGRAMAPTAMTIRVARISRVASPWRARTRPVRQTRRWCWADTARRWPETVASGRSRRYSPCFP